MSKSFKEYEEELQGYLSVIDRRLEGIQIPSNEPYDEALKTQIRESSRWAGRNNPLIRGSKNEGIIVLESPLYKVTYSKDALLSDPPVYAQNLIYQQAIHLFGLSMTADLLSNRVMEANSESSRLMAVMNRNSPKTLNRIRTTMKIIDALHLQFNRKKYFEQRIAVNKQNEEHCSMMADYATEGMSMLEETIRNKTDVEKVLTPYLERITGNSKDIVHRYHVLSSMYKNWQAALETQKRFDYPD
jgi:hypothetical protein